MALMYPKVLIIGLVIAAVGILAFHIIKRKGEEFSGGTKAANTHFVKDLPEYKRKRVFRRVLLILAELLLILGIVSSLVLAARPYETRTVTSGTKKRDIFLCLDVSYSICYLNEDLVQSLKDVVGGLKGDRFGITIFNTSTVLYVPLTDDYDFVNAKLDELQEYFDLQIKYWQYVDEEGYLSEPEEGWDAHWEEYYDIRDKLDYYDAGTLIKNYTKGSSLIGEGLTACLYSFPSLDDEERTRVIIMSTDNAEEALARPTVELNEAGDLCKKNKVTVFGIFPDRETFSITNDRDYEADLSDLKKNLEKTGGVVYEQSRTLTVDDIVKDIQKQEAMEVDEITTTRTVDVPETWIIVLVVSLIGFIAIGLVLKR